MHRVYAVRMDSTKKRLQTAEARRPSLDKVCSFDKVNRFDNGKVNEMGIAIDNVFTMVVETFIRRTLADAVDAGDSKVIEVSKDYEKVDQTFCKLVSHLSKGYGSPATLSRPEVGNLILSFGFEPIARFDYEQRFHAGATYYVCKWTTQKVTN